MAKVYDPIGDNIRTKAKTLASRKAAVAAWGPSASFNSRMAQKNLDFSLSPNHRKK